MVAVVAEACAAAMAAGSVQGMADLQRLLPNLGADAAPPQPSGQRCSSPTSAPALLLPDVGPAHLLPNLGTDTLFPELLPDLEQVYKFMD